ncbi:Ger(x)C family spore germination protein [Bacillus sp. Marseille-P3661]|uniref:Ger(x)C family spore germination protein n=1 Tax=Bacillus sp. Marseille-P3661 TaxID=1936234 RepID=UPI000C8417B4|nr:Ger(x)C family spore germination protein [Bacillus sp. Marseille-P3661]
MRRTIFVILCILLLSGCWDRKELNQIGIVAAIGIDKDQDTGDFLFTSQVLKPAAESTQTPSPDKPFLLVSTTGKTIFEAIRKTNQIVDRRGFYAHNKVIIISEELAKEGLLPILDSFQRGKEIRGYVWIGITKDTSARKILETKTMGVSRIPANFLKNVFENTPHHLNSTSINMLSYYKDSLAEGIDPVAGVLNIEDNENSSQKKNVKLSGGAVFKGDKLVGFLNDSETRGYRWVKGDIETGAISLPSLLHENKYATVEVTKMDATIKPEVNGERISFTIDITQEGLLTEQQATETFESSKQLVDYLDALEKENKKIIEEEINKAINKAQSLQADIFGFGTTLNKEDPDTWNRVKEDWSERFAEVPYSLNVNVNITSSGLMKGPFKPEE